MASSIWTTEEFTCPICSMYCTATKEELLPSHPQVIHKTAPSLIKISAKADTETQTRKKPCRRCPQPHLKEAPVAAASFDQDYTS